MGNIFVAAIFALIAFFVLTSIFKPRKSVSDDGASSHARLTRAEIAKLQTDKACPKCGERVKLAAAECRFCGHEFDPATIVATKTVVLANAGERKIPLIKAIRVETNLGLKEAKDIVDAAPTVFAKDVSIDEAMRLKRLFELNGAAVEIV